MPTRLPRVRKYSISGSVSSVVEPQPLVDRLGRVVGAALLGRAPEHPLDAHLVGELELEDDVEVAADLAQHLLERLGLRHRAREAVEHEALARVLVAEPLADQRDHQVVGHELARVVDRLHLPAELRARRTIAARSMSPGRHVRDAVLRGDQPPLGSLAGSLRAEQQDVGHYFRKPS